MNDILFRLNKIELQKYRFNLIEEPNLRIKIKTFKMQPPAQSKKQKTKKRT